MLHFVFEYAPTIDFCFPGRASRLSREASCRVEDGGLPLLRLRRISPFVGLYIAVVRVVATCCIGAAASPRPGWVGGHGVFAGGCRGGGRQRTRDSTVPPSAVCVPLICEFRELAVEKRPTRIKRARASVAGRSKTEELMGVALLLGCWVALRCSNWQDRNNNAKAWCGPPV